MSTSNSQHKWDDRQRERLVYLVTTYGTKNWNKLVELWNQVDSPPMSKRELQNYYYSSIDLRHKEVARCREETQLNTHSPPHSPHSPHNSPVHPQSHQNYHLPFQLDHSQAHQPQAHQSYQQQLLQPQPFQPQHFRPQPFQLQPFHQPQIPHGPSRDAYFSMQTDAFLKLASIQAGVIQADRSPLKRKLEPANFDDDIRPLQHDEHYEHEGYLIAGNQSPIIDEEAQNRRLEMQERRKKAREERDRESEEPASVIRPVFLEQNNEEENEAISNITNYIMNTDSFADLSKLPGLTEVKKSLFASFTMPNVLGRDVSTKSMLLYGPPGTGKTLVVKALAKVLNATYFQVDAGSISSKYKGTSAKLVEALFKVANAKAKSQSPCLIFFDEADASMGNRSGSDSRGTQTETATFLTQMQTMLDSSSNIIFIAATNHPWVIDTAFRRRFDLALLVPLPTTEELFAHLEYHMDDYQSRKGIHWDEHIDKSKLANLMNAKLFSGADVTTLFKTLLIKETQMLQKQLGLESCNYEVAMKMANERTGVEGHVTITYQIMEELIMQFHPATTKEQIDKFNSWQ